MSRKMRIFIPVLVAILILTAGSAAMVLAQEGEEEPTSPAETNGLLARVAEILGISPEELMTAFRQARQEMTEEKWTEAFDRALDKAVEKGLLTAEEAEEIREWWAQKPESLNMSLLRRFFSFVRPHPGPRREGMPPLSQEFGPKAWRNLSPEAYHELLDEALASRRLSEEEVGKLREWLEKRPEKAKGISTLARIYKSLQGRQKLSLPRGLGQMERPESAD